MYVAPGTIAGLPYDRDVTEVGFQGELRVWARAGEPLFPVVADVAGIESGLNAGVISAALRARFQELDVPLSSAHVTVGSRTIGKPGDSIYTSSWLVVDGASDAAYSIVPRDGILVVSEAHAVDVQIVGGYSTEGADAVPASARSVVDVMRQQQRLRYLGYPGQSGPLRVDGVMSGDTQRAIGLFCAAVTGGEPVLRDEFTAEGAAFINAVNAPR
jgi:hypothetical protein